MDVGLKVGACFLGLPTSVQLQNRVSPLVSRHKQGLKLPLQLVLRPEEEGDGGSV